jgi:hypothetical protein
MVVVPSFVPLLCCAHMCMCTPESSDCADGCSTSSCFNALGVDTLALGKGSALKGELGAAVNWKVTSVSEQGRSIGTCDQGVFLASHFRMHIWYHDHTSRCVYCLMITLQGAFMVS